MAGFYHFLIPKKQSVSAMPDLSSTISALVSSGAIWQPPKTVKIGEGNTGVRTLSGIRYNYTPPSDDDSSSRLQSLHITFPSDLVSPSATQHAAQP